MRAMGDLGPVRSLSGVGVQDIEVGDAANMMRALTNSTKHATTMSQMTIHVTRSVPRSAMYS